LVLLGKIKPVKSEVGVLKKYTVLAVLRGNEILMQYKLRGPFTNVWNLPGGKIEPEEGDQIIESGLRELKEETGIVVSPMEVTQLAQLEYKKVMPAELHLLVVIVPIDTTSRQLEDEPLFWAKQKDVVENKLPTAGYFNVPHFVALAVEYARTIKINTM
jgi:8-oxo-dGTP pyrophosphatase MutT (NUDIX family)